MNVKNRNRCGIRLEDWCIDWKIKSNEQNIQLQIQHKIREDPTNVENILTPDDETDPKIWQYWHLREICASLTDLVVLIETDCECPASGNISQETVITPISYYDSMIHTLESASSTLLSREELNTAKLQTIALHMFKVFEHAYTQHRDIFIEFEFTSSLYSRFKELVGKRSCLIPIGSLELICAV